MKNLYLLVFILIMTFACNSAKNATISEAASEDKQNTLSDTVRIANEDVAYEVIIIEPGFNFWLASRAQPRSHYSLNYLQTRNIRYVSEWNNRVLQPNRFNPNLYEMQINYLSTIDYGYEVNYLLYNYFIYFQNTYKQNLLGGRVPLN